MPSGEVALGELTGPRVALGVLGGQHEQAFDGGEVVRRGGEGQLDVGRLDPATMHEHGPATDAAPPRRQRP